MKNFLKYNTQMKIFSVVFAFFMWIYVMAEVDPIIIRDIDDVPVTITNQAVIDNLELVPEYGTDLNVRVSLRGRRSLLNAVINEGLLVNGQVENPAEGSAQVNLELANIRENVEYTIFPQNLNMVLERNLVVRKNINIVRTGELEQDYGIKEIQLNPSSTFVEGPRSLVNSVTGLSATLDISGHQNDFSKKLTIIPVNSNNEEVQGVRVNETAVFAHAVVVKEKTVPVNINLADSQNEGVRLSGYTITPAEIKILGKSPAIDSVDQIQTEPLSIDQLAENPQTTVSLVMPEGISSDITEVNINSTTESLLTKEFNISKDRIEIRGNGQMPEISDNESVPDIIAVEVLVTSELFDDLTANDIILFIEMQDYVNDPANVPIQAESEKSTERIDITPLEVDLQG